MKKQFFIGALAGIVGTVLYKKYASEKVNPFLQRIKSKVAEKLAALKKAQAEKAEAEKKALADAKNIERKLALVKVQDAATD